MDSKTVSYEGVRGLNNLKKEEIEKSNFSSYKGYTKI